jgi:hypothetical protein
VTTLSEGGRGELVLEAAIDQPAVKRLRGGRSVLKSDSRAC